MQIARFVSKSQIIILIAWVVMVGCSGVAGSERAETATAQAERAVSMATQMGEHVQSTLVAENQKATATTIARQTLLQDARQWWLQISDPFDENLHGWATGKQENPDLGSIEWSITGGKYIWQAKAKSSFVWWVIPDGKAASDFYLAVSARQSSHPEVGEYGVIFRQSEDSNYYLFEVSEAGKYALFLHSSEGWETLIDWTSHSAISPGITKRLEVVASGPLFNFYVNGKFINEYTDDRLTQGMTGLLVGLANEGDEAAWEFDDYEWRVR